MDQYRLVDHTEGHRTVMSGGEGGFIRVFVGVEGGGGVHLIRLSDSAVLRRAAGLAESCRWRED